MHRSCNFQAPFNAVDFFDLVKGLITNRKYAFVCVFEVELSHHVLLLMIMIGSCPL